MDQENQNKNEQPQASPPEQSSTPEPAPDATPTPPPAEPGQEPHKGYGKRPWWQWLIIYLVIGAIVYGIAYLVIANTGDNNGGTIQY
jgi:hypothetical protein